MGKGAKEGISTSSNLIESKNSIFKTFAKKLKCFEAVALMENFDIKTRGVNKSTNAFMRAGVDLEEYGAKDFFEAINLAEIVLGNTNLNETPAKIKTQKWIAA